MGNEDIYAKIMKELINTYILYSESVDKVVEVWKPMLNNSASLKKTFNLLIMTEFVETIWSDDNIKVLMDEIVKNKDYLTQYQKELNDLMAINKNLERMTGYLNKQEAAPKPDQEEYSPTEEDAGHHSTTCHQCHKPHFPKKKKAKSKETKPQK